MLDQPEIEVIRCAVIQVLREETAVDDDSVPHVANLIVKKLKWNFGSCDKLGFLCRLVLTARRAIGRAFRWT